MERGIKVLIDQVTDLGELIDEYPVDESQMISNTGDAEVYLLDTDAEGTRQVWEIITWNQNAMSHRPGDRTIRLIDQYSTLE